MVNTNGTDLKMLHALQRCDLVLTSASEFERRCNAAVTDTCHIGSVQRTCVCVCVCARASKRAAAHVQLTHDDDGSAACADRKHRVPGAERRYLFGGARQRKWNSSLVVEEWKFTIVCVCVRVRVCACACLQMCCNCFLL